MHFYVGRPVVPLREFRGWLAAEWFRIVASGDLRHLHAGTGLDRQFVARSKSVRSIAWYFVKHNAKAAKHYQNEVPPGFEHVGRFWGVWGLSSRVETVQLSPSDFIRVRRVIGGLRRAGMRRPVRTAPTARVCEACSHADCEAWRILAARGHRGAVVRMASGMRGAWTLATAPARVAAQLGRWLGDVELGPDERRVRWAAMGAAATSGACSLGHICTACHGPRVEAGLVAAVSA